MWGEGRVLCLREERFYISDISKVYAIDDIFTFHLDSSENSKNKTQPPLRELVIRLVAFPVTVQQAVADDN